jgi:protein-S-isoprenylcysteine O-methyltransferase Ste14
VTRNAGSERGGALGRWFRGLPRTTRRIVGVVLVLGYLVLWYAALFAFDGALGDDDVTWADPLSSMVGPIIGITLVFWLRRRQMGSWGRVWDFDEAARRGHLPENADPAEWGPLLDQAHRFQRGARSVALGLVVLMAIATVVASMWAGFGWAVVVGAGLVGAVLVALVELGSRRQSQRIDRLQDQLRSGPDQGALTPGG